MTERKMITEDVRVEAVYIHLDRSRLRYETGEFGDMIDGDRDEVVLFLKALLTAVESHPAQWIEIQALFGYRPVVSGMVRREETQHEAEAREREEANRTEERKQYLERDIAQKQAELARLKGESE